LRVDLVPPSQAYEATTGNVFEVVEIGSEEEDGDDEDEDAGRLLASWLLEGGGKDVQVRGEEDTEKVN
jgi:hypothetical protein